MKNIIIALWMLFAVAGCQESNTKEKQTSGRIEQTDSLVFSLEKIASGFDGPLAFENAHDGSGRMFIGEQAGRIVILKKGKILPTPFLNIRKLLVPMKNEYMDMGLLGFAFHPDYKHNGRFFVHFSKPSAKGANNTSVLAEFHVSDTNPDIAINKAITLLEVEQPESNHNGGNIVFDDKGYLYLGFGDGGGQGDKHGKIGNGQDLNQLLGKVIRIDVDHEKPYSIPKDNPITNGRKEIWCYGMRMPWRISFDPETKQLFCGDVGQDTYEEVDILEKGKNYGWRAMEGFHIYDSVLYDQSASYALPVAEYKHPEGVSITGGYVYRGKEFPAMQGKYIFGDWAFKLFYLQKDNSGKWEKKDCAFKDKPDNKFPFRINSFGLDEAGELYVVTQDTVGAISPTGVIYRMGATR